MTSETKYQFDLLNYTLLKYNLKTRAILYISDFTVDKAFLQYGD